MVEANNYVPITSIPAKIQELSTVVFIDYESWFWGLYNRFGETPDLADFIVDLKKRGKIDRISFFGDFSKPEMENELSKIRTITNDITNCQSTNKEMKKDYTDFIMLDHVYKTIIGRPEIEQYVLVTGDGHYHSVAAFLRTFKDKIVGAYGVKGSFSSQLVSSSSWAIEITPKKIEQNHFQSKVLKTIQWAEVNGILPSFRKTVEVSSKHYRGEQAKFSAALKKLIDDGYITQEEQTTPKGTKINVLLPKWALINKHKLMEEEVV